MSNRQKWWNWELLSWLIIMIAIIILPDLSWWQYLVMGICFGMYAICCRKQDKL